MTSDDTRLSLVSVRVGLEADGIHDSLVVHQLVPFVVRKRVELISFRVPDNLMRFDDLGFFWVSGVASGFLPGRFDA